LGSKENSPESGSFVAGNQQQSLAKFSLTVSSNEAQHILI
jgi:hypothetical protein